MSEKMPEVPQMISFTGLDIPAYDLRKAKASKSGPIPMDWARVQFAIPDGYSSARTVEEWLANNCPGDWTAYHYSNPKARNSTDRIMVVRFADKNDAMMFKLKGGHQAWQN